MRIAGTLLVFVLLALVSACTFQSDTLIPDARVAGDPIAGLPTDRAFGLESFDRQRNSFHRFGTMTPQSGEGGKVGYILAFTDDSDRLAIHAKQLSAGTYLLRYTETGYPDANAGQTALVMLSAEGGNFYVLTSLADKVLFESIFPGANRPLIDGDEIKLESEEQALDLAEFLHDHRDRLRADQDYIRIRLAP